MAQLGTLLTALSRRLGTSVGDRFTEPKKEEGLNEARRQILLRYDLEDFIKETTVSFTSGIGTIPTDYLRTVTGENTRKVVDNSTLIVSTSGGRDLWNDSTDRDYSRVTIAKFDNDVQFTWTIKQSAGTKSFFIFTADTVTLNLRYIEDRADLSADTDESGFSTQFDNAHVLWAAYLLLHDSREFGGDVTERMKQRSREAMQFSITQAKRERGAPTASGFDNATMLSSPGNAVQDFVL